MPKRDEYGRKKTADWGSRYRLNLAAGVPVWHHHRAVRHHNKLRPPYHGIEPPLPCSILHNQGKTKVLPVLPPMASLQIHIKQHTEYIVTSKVKNIWHQSGKKCWNFSIVLGQQYMLSAKLQNDFDLNVTSKLS